MSRRLKRAVKRLPLFAICRKAIRRTTAIVEGLKYLDARVWQRERGNRCIYQALVSGEPQAIGKLGSTELLALKAHLALRHCPGWAEATTFNRHQLYVNAGVYPEQPEIYRRFCDYVLRQVLPEMTVVGVWFKPGEAHILRHYAHHASRVPSRSLETYYSAGHRWTSALEGKTVLVMHPFVRSIREQYDRRSELWPGREDVLPRFRLVQLRVPHLPSLVKPDKRDWFASLEDMKKQMSCVTFDVALIGAGAYSLPLALHAKMLGRCGIHLGGSAQIYFGIKGHRWDQHPFISKLFNPHWIRPLAEDVPPGNDLIEGGCYW